ncbi:hypothetical protein PQE73_gp045 [Bacillus phage vB_BanS_MrDarsey]|uniref:Uncharacterized protein n=2 Tax=Caudoviricetes TaxID=2731619 RepID=A0AAE9CBW2_9CAUD|nr:hypothetical protein PQE73_gp045 [Bacillus phage vB_BanS_MrDarsey]UGO47877.1 hypothetical protein MRDARSEY_45 [Bacillus phage vB_BanS_MrDarsey]
MRMMKRKLRGTHIRATKDDISEIVHYNIVWDVYNGCYRILCLDTCNIMARKNGFKNEEEIRRYFARTLKMEIISWSENNL